MIMGFDELYGHASVKRTLQKMLLAGHIANSYVFEGPAGVGKRLCAALFAKALLCESIAPETAPCGTCSSCTKVASGNHPDIIRVKKAEDGASIGVDEVREQILSEVYLKPYLAARRVVVIGEGDLLTESAQNALLKVLEEPPDYITFIICVTGKDKLLETVLSRSCVMTFFPLAREDVLRYLKTQFDEQKASLAAGISQGSIGGALVFLQDENGEKLFEDSIAHLMSLKQDAAIVREVSNFLLEERERIDGVCNYMMTFLRDCIFVKSGLLHRVIYESKLPKIHVFIEDIRKRSLVSAFDRLVALQLRMVENLNYSASVFETMMCIWEDFHDKGSGHSI
ncbi:MAG: DNA polymerase III subunit [Clostridia bacterium]|nr:DNA polymerase III subunit [Clostridia bacterium]